MLSVVTVAVPAVVSPVFAMIAVLSFGAANVGVEGGSRWYRMLDRTVAQVARPAVVVLLCASSCSWAAGVVAMFYLDSATAAVSMVLSVALLCISQAFNSSVFTCDRARDGVWYVTAPDTVGRALFLLTALTVAGWSWSNEAGGASTLEFVAAVVAVLAFVGVALARALARRRNALTRALTAADELQARLITEGVGAGDLMSVAFALDRALSTRLTSGFALLGTPIADKRCRDTLLTAVHSLAGSPAPSGDDPVLQILQNDIRADRPEQLRAEVTDYCRHIRAVLRPRADVVM